MHADPPLVGKEQLSKVLKCRNKPEKDAVSAAKPVFRVLAIRISGPIA